MAFDINLSEGTGTIETVTVDRHLYLTEDRSRVVEEDDPSSRWLWASPGDEVPRDEAEKLGAVKAAPKPRDKQQEKPADKSAGAPPSKAGKPADDLDALREQAENVGVTVDKRWGVDRLRQEIADAGRSKGK